MIFLYRPLAFSILALAAAFLPVAGLLHAQDNGLANKVHAKSFGPVITYDKKEPTHLNFTFYTDKNERPMITFRTSGVSYFRMEDKKSHWHKFPFRAEAGKTVEWQISCDDRYLRGKGGKISIPGPDSFRFGILGDTRPENGEYTYELTEQLAMSIADRKPNFLLHVGDMVIDPVDRNDWTEFFFKLSSVISGAAFVPAIGNHDLYTPLWKKLFVLPDHNYPFYSYDMPNAKFIVLTAMQYFGRDSLQYRWLTNELASAKSGDFKIVVIHHAPFSSTDHAEEADTLAVNAILVPVFEQYHVDLVLSGHDHLYERKEKSGVVYVTSGGGAPLPSVGSASNPFRKAIVRKRNHYTMVEVTKTAITIDAYDLHEERLDHAVISK